MILKLGLRAIGYLVVIGAVGVPGAPVHAGMIGTPIAKLASRGLSVGLEGSVINRDLAFDSAADTDINLVEMMVRGTLGILEPVDLFAVVGMADDDLQVSNFFSSPVTDLKFLASPALAYGAGFKMTVFELTHVDLGTGGHFERFVLEGRSATPSPNASDATLVWQEYLFFAGASFKRVPYFVPYGGLYLTVLRGRLSFSNPSLPSTDVAGDHSLGIFYGGDFTVWNGLALSAEFHLIAETSIAFSLQYSF